MVWYEMLTFLCSLPYIINDDNIFFVCFSHSWHHIDHYYSIVFIVTEAMVVSIPALHTGMNYLCIYVLILNS